MSLPFDPDPDFAWFELTLILDPFDLLKAATIGGYPVNPDDLLRELYRYSTDPDYRTALQDAAAFGLLKLIDERTPPVPLINLDDPPF